MSFLRALRCCLCATLAACEPTAFGVLIEAQGEGDIDSLRVFVRDLATLEDDVGSAQPIARTREEQLSGDPIRVAIELDRAASLMVHLSASNDDGDRFVATRCYEVNDIVRDNVLLVALDPSVDADADGFPESDIEAACFEPDGEDRKPCRASVRCAASVARDCDGHCADCTGCASGMCVADGNADIHPGATELCEDGVDQDCDGVDDTCGDVDADGYTACRSTDIEGTCDCDDQDPTRNPAADEICGDGIDQDCTGSEPLCDRDGDLSPADRLIGGSPDCNDDDPTVFPGATELCDEIDNDCDDRIDDSPSCFPADLDGDGSEACEAPATEDCDCNDCDRGISPDGDEICGNGIDEDCDGSDQECPEGDTDHDGVRSVSDGGMDCDDSDARVFPQAPDLCDDDVAQNCIEDRSCDDDLDGDGYVERSACEDNEDSTPWITETCNGMDDNCDGRTDEVLSAPVTGYPQGTDGCVMVADLATVVTFASDVLHCGGCRIVCGAGADDCVDGSCICSTGSDPSAECGSTETCCTDGCSDLDTQVTNCGVCGNDCNSSAQVADGCSGGDCRCGSGPACTGSERCCGGACIDPSADLSNCGACGNVCGAHQACTGRCECVGSYLDCDRDQGTGCEVDPATNNDHCGGCDTPCRPSHASPMCTSSGCEIATCDDGWADCDSDLRSCETALGTPLHCASCGDVCTTSVPGATPDCVDGSCDFACMGSLTRCDGQCVNTNSNDTYCGNCTTSCTGDLTCISGNCDCASGTECGTDCYDTNTDNSHCGDCTTTCTGDLTCIGGDCDCASGTKCGTDCYDTDNDNAHCGDCVTACMGELTCIAGDCQCSGLETQCGTDCTNILSDEAHCGIDCLPCPVGETCSAGICHCGVSPGSCDVGQQCDSGACICVDDTGCMGGQECCGDGTCAPTGMCST